MSYKNSLLMTGIPGALSTVKPTTEEHGLNYGARNCSMAIIMFDGTAAWSDTVTFYGLIGNDSEFKWVEITDVTATFNAAGDPTVIYSPPYQIAWSRICAVADTDPGASCMYMILSDTRAM